ncbi:MAG TPA: outer membrane protein assembly factor BamD [Nitrospiraceae bacterium]|nr:outer membrane protein assembly factor BamD [Nitrospiraceae bacterium]
MSVWCLGTPVSASAQQVLDRVEIVETPTAAEIHIAFNTRIIYQRHTPSDRGDLIRVFLDLPDLDRSRRFARELAASPPSDLLPKFTVTFPDQGTTGLAIRFTRPVRFRISQRGNERNKIVISVKLERPAMPPPPPPEVRVPSPGPAEAKKPTQAFDIPTFRPGMNVETYASDLMQLGQAALTAGEHEKAVQIFNALLNLPPNKQSREAQEMVGVARERNGEISKAIAEYEHYLKTYPEGEEAARVQQRLTALTTATAQTAQRKAAGRTPKRIDETSVYGSVYQYYYGGYSQSETTDKVSNTTTTFNNHDQSLLQTAFDVTGRYRKNEYDNKLVVRGTESYDLLATDDARKSISRLRALYFEHSSQDSYLVRVGRQPGNMGGMLDFRFDGAWIRYTPLPQLLSVNLLAGQPRQFSLTPNYVPDDPRNFTLESNRYFYGANVDIGPIGQAWSGNTYYYNQMVNGVVDRRAVGAELRYASNGKNIYSLVDYDIYFNALNIATLNGTWVTEGTTFNFMADHRRTPYLQTTNALFGIPGASLDNINKESESLLRTEAKNVTATSDLFLAGVLHSVSKDWQLGGDVRLNRISGASASQCLIIAPGTSTVFLNPNAVTDASCSLQGIPGTGNIWTYTVQAIGNDFPFEKNTFVMNASYISSDAYRGESLTLNSLGRFWQQWQVDLFLILYHQKDINNVNLYRGTPTLRIDYRFFDSWTFEASGGVEKTLTDSSTQKDSTLREFFFFGLRWDFS